MVSEVATETASGKMQVMHKLCMLDARSYHITYLIKDSGRFTTLQRKEERKDLGVYTTSEFKSSTQLRSSTPQRIL